MSDHSSIVALCTPYYVAQTSAGLAHHTAFIDRIVRIKFVLCRARRSCATSTDEICQPSREQTLESEMGGEEGKCGMG